MKNVDRLARHIARYGADGILVHTIPGTSSWLICQKIEKDKWTMTMGNPMGYVTYNLGTVSDSQHVQLWTDLVKMEIETKVSQIKMVNELKNKINESQNNG